MRDPAIDGSNRCLRRRARAFRSKDEPMALALNAIRETARLAWWDGSAIGLKLGRLMGLCAFAEIGFAKSSVERS